jgi:hypothetical protein
VRLQRVAKLPGRALGRIDWRPGCAAANLEGTAPDWRGERWPSETRAGATHHHQTLATPAPLHDDTGSGRQGYSETTQRFFLAFLRVMFLAVLPGLPRSTTIRIFVLFLLASLRPSLLSLTLTLRLLPFLRVNFFLPSERIFFFGFLAAATGLRERMLTLPAHLTWRQLSITSSTPPIGRRTEPPMVVMSVGRRVLVPPPGLTTAAAGVNV